MVRSQIGKCNVHSEDKIFKGNALLFAICALLILFSFPARAQVVYEPLYKDVYNFLRRLSQKQVIVFNDEIRPLSRKYLAEKLVDAENKSEELTSLEKEELEFFKADYLNEFDLLQNKSSDHLTYFNTDPAGRWRFFSYSSEAFKMNAGIIFGYEAGSRDKKKLTHQWNGVYTNGYLYDKIGYSFDFRDNTEKGNTIDKQKLFTPVTGVNERSDFVILDYAKDKIEYSEAKAVIATDWKWGSVAAGKDFLEWATVTTGCLFFLKRLRLFLLFVWIFRLSIGLNSITFTPGSNRMWLIQQIFIIQAAADQELTSGKNILPLIL